ncbi:hypothetical protein FRACYDRAFT_248162 [Fragilariopsis cylindrus CCMP1102]|uniref:Nitroreductase domain-containing protein n=1 Tax=Fragilariopsis cylindrus CCMP1102 TaxID=635003 RepID=A0A1E7EVJ2_9STRA|nr:hypothetical protein FRACYDRAFT_248162 [Fragilariopsis cylindrus CCMP1102]|eukprot:OEU09912.1 hypothetical protein FRACYDRAFT_248162 [Fragilariopsis cylindrus CCMP1102]
MKCRRFTLSVSTSTSGSSAISKSLTSSASASSLIIVFLLASLQFLTTNSNAFVIERIRQDLYETFDYKPFLQGEGKDFQSLSVGSTDADAALASLNDNDNANNNNSNTNILTLDESIQARYAATRYKRYDGNYNTSEGRTPSTSNPDVIKKARTALQLAIRAPSGFNVQPYKMVMINTPSSKLKLSKYCIGRNIDRVLDSDCTIIFLADRQVMRSWKPYKTMIQKQEEESSASTSTSTSTTKKKKTKWNYLKLRLLIGLFSSGYPYIPKIIAGPISWCIRVGMRIVSWCTRSWLVVPTLSSAECWSQKNTALVAMSYMLGCTSRSLVTTPMEGYLSWGIRQSFNISRRYTIPLIISTGIPYTARPYTASNTENENESDDTGISHGNTKETSTPRFEYDSIVEEK